MGARELTHSRGGDWRGSYGLVAGPGHSEADRSLKVWQVGDRVYCHSFAGDDWRECRRHLGLEDGRERDHGPSTPTPEPAKRNPGIAATQQVQTDPR